MPILFFVLGLFIFVSLVVAHEYGHFLAAKRGGVEVEEFGIGFPPKLVGRTMGKGIFRGYYTINALPLGGFVKLKGENSSDTRPGTFGAASYRRKVLIMTAGVIMNIVAAVVLLTVVAFAGVPVAIPNQFTVAANETITEDRLDVSFIDNDSPASKAGVEFGDYLISYNGEVVSTLEEVDSISESASSAELSLRFFDTSQGQVVEASVQPRENPGENEGYLGVGLNEYQEKSYTWAAPIVGLGLTVQFAWETLALLGGIITSLFVGNVAEASQGVSGPVGIFYIFTQVDSVVLMLFIGGLISVSLAIMNILPIPALDGGRLAVTSIFKFLKKPLPEDLENKIHGFGMAFLMLLVVLITIVDVDRFF